VVVHRIEGRLEQLRFHVKLFGFLNNFQNIQKAEIRKHTIEFKAALIVITIKQSRPADGDVVNKKRTDVASYVLGEELVALKTFFPPGPLRHMLCLDNCS